MLVSVYTAVSPSVICAGSMVAYTKGASAEAPATMAKYRTIAVIHQPLKKILAITNSCRAYPED
jgi:hypothetical protein